MCENKDHNQQQFSANSTILLGFGLRYGITDDATWQCFPDDVEHITQFYLLVQSWMCCKHPNKKTFQQQQCSKHI